MHKYHFGDISVKPWPFYVFFGLFWSPKRGEWMVLEGYPKRPVRTGFERFFIGFSKIPKIRNCKLNQYCNCCNCNWRSGPNRLHSGPVHQFLTVLWTGLSNTSPFIDRTKARHRSCLDSFLQHLCRSEVNPADLHMLCSLLSDWKRHLLSIFIVNLG